MRLIIVAVCLAAVGASPAKEVHVAREMHKHGFMQHFFRGSSRVAEKEATDQFYRTDETQDWMPQPLFASPEEDHVNADDEADGSHWEKPGSFELGFDIPKMPAEEQSKDSIADQEQPPQDQSPKPSSEPQEGASHVNADDEADGSQWDGDKPSKTALEPPSNQQKMLIELGEASLRFEVRCDIASRTDALFVVGSAPELGEWNPNKGLRLRTGKRFPKFSNSGDLGAANAPSFVAAANSGILEYKFMMVREDGTVFWEQVMENRQIELQPGASITVKTTWGDAAQEVVSQR